MSLGNKILLTNEHFTTSTADKNPPIQPVKTAGDKDNFPIHLFTYMLTTKTLHYSPLLLIRSLRMCSVGVELDEGLT